MYKLKAGSRLVSFAMSAILLAGYSASVGSAAASIAPAPKASPAMNLHGGENDALDFDLTNKTGYGITTLYIGKSGNKEWHDNDEVTIPGGSIDDRSTLHIHFSPKQKYEVWDVYVKFEDGIEAEFDELDLTQINKLTLHYNAKTKETTTTKE